MSARPPVPPRAELRGFRWPLRPLETRLDANLETAKLALAVLQRKERALDEVLRHRTAHHAQQQQLAAECLQRAPGFHTHVLGYLTQVQQGLAQARCDASALALQLDAARADCLERQRQLACVQRMREAAQRSHVQERRRREAREADAAWLAGVPQRSCARPAGRKD